MRIFAIKIGLIGFCLLFFQLCLEAQQQEGNKAPVRVDTSNITQLKKGLLVVRLPSRRNQVEAIMGLIAKTASEDVRKGLIEKLISLQTEKAIMHNQYVYAMEEEYNFSRVGFIYDYQTRDFLDGKISAMRSDLATPIQTPAEGVYLLSFRDADGSTAKLTILHSGLQAPERPFPNNFIAGGITTILSFMRAEEPAYYQVRRMNAKLWRYSGLREK